MITLIISLLISIWVGIASIIFLWKIANNLKNNNNTSKKYIHEFLWSWKMNIIIWFITLIAFCVAALKNINATFKDINEWSAYLYFILPTLWFLFTTIKMYYTYKSNTEILDKNITKKMGNNATIRWDLESIDKIAYNLTEIWETEKKEQKNPLSIIWKNIVSLLLAWLILLVIIILVNHFTK